METVAIVGVGLIGASFGLALRKAGFAGQLLGVSSPRSIEAGVRVGAIERGVPLAEAASGADLIYLSQPIEQILETLKSLGPLVRPGCLITDAGSTKALIVSTAQEHLPPDAFLGGHPMAGKEQRGAEAADADLFQGKPYVLTPQTLSGKHTSPNPQEADFRAWLLRLGAVIVEMNPCQHDATVALTSHLPQLLSTTLAATLAGQDNQYLSQVFGPGLLDMTRLSLSAPEVWMSVLATNKAAVQDAIGLFQLTLTDLQAQLQQGSILDLFNLAGKFSTTLRNSPYSNGSTK